MNPQSLPFKPAPEPPYCSTARPFIFLTPNELMETKMRGDWHPCRNFTKVIPSLPGPRSVCPVCCIQYKTEWLRDLHYAEAHMLGIPAYFRDREDLEVAWTKNYDGILGKEKHVLDPWVFCEEPEAYADQNGDVINESTYIPPSGCVRWYNGIRYVTNVGLPPRAQIWFGKLYNNSLAKQIAWQSAMAKQAAWNIAVAQRQAAMHAMALQVTWGASMTSQNALSSSTANHDITKLQEQPYHRILGAQSKVIKRRIGAPIGSGMLVATGRRR